MVSCIDSPLYSLASYIHEIIYNSIPKHFSHIQDSFHLVRKLNGKDMDEGYKLISLNVVSLFTNLPTKLLIVSKRWNQEKMDQEKMESHIMQHKHTA